MNNNKPICVKCNSNVEVVKILYGRPSPKGQQDAKEGKIVLGGCCPKSEKWKCKNCKSSFK